MKEKEGASEKEREKKCYTYTRVIQFIIRRVGTSVCMVY